MIIIIISALMTSLSCVCPGSMSIIMPPFGM